MGKKKSKKRKNAILNWILILALLGGVAGVSINSYKQSQKETRWKLQDYQAAESVYTGDLQLSVLATATLHPYEILQVRPEASGKIEELYVDVGDWIEEGDPIALLDQESLMNSLDTAHAQLSNARAALDLAERGYTPREAQSYQAAVDNARIQYDQAEVNLTRIQSLHDAGFASDQELDNAMFAFNQALQALENAQNAYDVMLGGSTDEEIRIARANVEIASVAVRQAEDALGDATITAPMSGVVLDRSVNEGSIVVSTLASYSVGDSIITIGDLSKMKAITSVDENDIGMVEIGQKCLLTVDTYRDETFEGIVIKVHPQASLVGGITFFTVEVEVPNTDNRLMAGMTAEVEIVTNEIPGVLLVQDRAIVERDEKTYVFVVNDSDVLEVREIEIGETNYEDTEVLSGLEEGERVVVQGVPRDLLDEAIGKDEGSGGEVVVRVN